MVFTKKKKKSILWFQSLAALELDKSGAQATVPRRVPPGLHVSDPRGRPGRAPGSRRPGRPREAGPARRVYRSPQPPRAAPSSPRHLFAGTRTGGTRGAAAAPGGGGRLRPPLPEEPTRRSGPRRDASREGAIAAGRDRPRPPNPGAEAAPGLGCGSGEARRGPGQTMRDGGPGLRRGEPGGDPARPCIPARARPRPHPSSPAPPPGAARDPRRDPSSNRKTSPNSAEFNRALTVRCPGLPRGPSWSSSAPWPRRKTISGRSPGGGLETAAAEARSGSGDLGGAQEPLRSCSGSALALPTAPNRPRMRRAPLGRWAGHPGGGNASEPAVSERGARSCAPGLRGRAAHQTPPG